MKMNVFVVDHDAQLRDVIAKELQAIDYDVFPFANGKDAYEASDKVDVDLVILDPALPDMDGLRLIRHLRRKPGVGIIVLTSDSHVVDRIVGLETGADDYLSKPCHMGELIARVRSVLRRVKRRAFCVDATWTPVAYAFDGWRLDPSNFTVTRPDGRKLALTIVEFRILEFLLINPNRYWDARALSRVLPATRAADRASAVMTAIKRLRRRLGDSAREPRLIETLRGSGYKRLTSWRASSRFH